MRNVARGSFSRLRFGPCCRAMRVVWNSAHVHDAAAHPDMARCGHGIGMLLDIIAMVPESYHVQPLAVTGYILWWLGDDRAMPCAAIRALAIDEGCSLAAIVCSAVHRHVGPAWIGETIGDTP